MSSRLNGGPVTPDPRLNVTDSGLRGHDDQTRFWNQNKYSSAAAPIPMASWFEAQLIIAEASALSGDHGRAVEVRASFAGDDIYEPSETTATITWGAGRGRPI